MGIVLIILVAALIVALVALLVLAIMAGVPGSVVEQIATNEQLGGEGPAKMAQVVAAVSASLPAAIRKILTPEKIQDTAQTLFRWMRKYAVAYGKAAQSATEETPAAKINAEAAASLVSELFGLTMSALKEKAADYGVEIDDKALKRDVVEAIIVAILNKA